MASERLITKSHGTHIMQLDHLIGILVEPKPGMFVGVIAEMCNHLSIVERCTAQCNISICMQQNPITPASMSYQERLRTPTTDNHTSNNLGEKTIAQFGKLGQWKLWHSTCGIHIVQNLYTALYPMIEFDLRGVLHHALSLRLGVFMSLFRKALRTVVLSRSFSVKQGLPPASVCRHRSRMVNVFCNSGTNVLSRQLVLFLLPVSDWTKRSIEVYVGSAIVSASDVLNCMINGLLYVLAGTSFEILNRSRWHGKELCIDRCGIIEAVHFLGSETFDCFLHLVAGTRWSVRHSPDICVAMPALTPGDLDDRAASAGHRAASSDLGSADAQAANTSTTADANEETPAQRNSRNRVVAGQFWDSKPLYRLVVIRECLECLRVLMSNKVMVSGGAWELEQSRRMAAATLAGKPVTRDYRVTLCANNVHEDECLEKVQLLQTHGELWSCVGPAGLTMKNQCLAFRMLNHMKSGVTQMFVAVNEACPVVVFRLLTDPGASSLYNGSFWSSIVTNNVLLVASSLLTHSCECGVIVRCWAIAL
jgi:hypothetical protein